MPATLATNGREGNPGAPAPVSTQIRVLILAVGALERMAALLIRVSLPGFDPPQVRPSGRIRSECWRRFLPAPQGDEVRVSHRVYMTTRFGVRFF